MPTNEIQWANDSQRLGFERGPAPTLLSGGFGSGKTVCAIVKALYLMDMFPGYRVAIIRRRYKELWKTTLATLFKFVTPDMYNKGKRNDQQGELVLNNGSKFDFIHLETADISTVLLGLEINAFIFDQAEEMLEDTYDVLESRLERWDKAIIRPELVEEFEATHGRPWPWRKKDGVTLLPPSYALLTANPDNELHWLYKRFHPDSEEWRTKWRDLGYEMINFDSETNVFLGEQNLRTMLSKDEAFKKRYVKGIWGRPEGVLFEVSPLSIIEPTDDFIRYLVETCSLQRIMDHGYSAPTCCLWAAVDKEGNSFIYREYYNTTDQIREHRENITALSESLRHHGKPLQEHYKINLADPQIFKQMPTKFGGRYTVADEYSDVTIYPKETAIYWKPADNAEHASRLRLKEYLRVDMTRRHPITGEMGSPRLFFLQKTDDYPYGCDEAIKQTKAARLEKVGTINGKPIFSDERDETIPDHALDPVRYHVLGRPALASVTEAPLDPRTFAGYSRLAKEMRERSRALRNTSR